MKLNEREIKFFRDFSGTETAKVLLEYFDRLKVELFNPSVVTKENFEGRKEAFELLEKHFVERLRLSNKDNNGNPNQFM